MIKILMKKQLKMLFSGFFLDRRTGKAKTRAASAVGIAAYVLVMAGLMGGMFGYIEYSMCVPLCAAGLDWMYMAIIALMTLALGILGSVFNTYSSLYQAKDNDLLLSLPVPVSAILFTRLSGVYVMGAIFAAMVMIPGIIVYAIFAAPGVWPVISAVIVMVLVTFAILVLSCILGCVFGRIGNKTRNSSFITVLLSLIFIIAYYAVFMNANKMLNKVLAASSFYSRKIKSSIYPLYSVGSAATGDGMQLALLTAVMVGICVVTWVVIRRSFLSITTTKTGYKAEKNTAKKIKMQGVEVSLLLREFRRLGASAVYMLNCSLGTLLMLVVAVICMVKGQYILDTISKIPGTPDGIITFVACMAVCSAASMNDLTAPSVSLEGNTLWIVRSLPVSSWQILRAKVRMHVILTVVPALVLDAVMIALAKPSLADGVLMLLIPCIYVCLTGYTGLAVNLKMPKLEWISETAVVKQSMGVMVALLSNFAYIIVLVVGYVIMADKLKLTVCLVICVAVMTAVAVALRVWLRRRGVKIFEAL